MKTTIYLLAFIELTISSFAFAQKKPADTMYVSKDSLHGFKQSIFYEVNPDNKYYKGLTDFSFREFDKQCYDNSLVFLRKNKLMLPHRKPILNITKWVPLKLYKGHFYIYYPCDFYTYYKVSINDTTYIDWTGEGPVANKITKQQRINDTTFSFTTSGIYDIKRQITIHIIDKLKEIAVFEDQTKDGVSFDLMISAEMSRKIPLIVNNCEIRKQSEMKFDEPDYEYLLRKNNVK